MALLPRGGGGGPRRLLPRGWSHLQLSTLRPPLQLRVVGDLPAWELLRRREVRELIGDRGGFSSSNVGYPRFVLGVPTAEGWRLERLRLLLAPGSLMDLTGGRTRRYVLSGVQLQRLVTAFAGHPTPPRWRDRLQRLEQQLESSPPRQLPRSTPLVPEPLVTEAAPRPFPAPTRIALPMFRDSGGELVFGLDPRWDLALHLQWLAGLVDGDGTLSVRSGGGTQLSIAGHRQEVEVLERVRTLLGHGSVSSTRGGQDNRALFCLSYGYRL